MNGMIIYGSFSLSFRRDVPESAASAARSPPTCTCRWRARAGPRRPGRSSVRATRTSIGASAQRRCAARRHWGRACARSGRRSRPDRDSWIRKRCQTRGTVRRMSAELRAVRAREGREKQRGRTEPMYGRLFRRLDTVALIEQGCE